MNSERKVILFKVEAPAGTDAVPVGATDAFQAIDFKWGNAGKANTDQFDYASPYYGARDVFNVAMQRDCSFDIPVIGGSAPLGTNYPAALLALYRACGHAAVETPATSVVFSPISNGEETGSLYAHEDTIRRKMLYSRGSMKWLWTENKVPRCTVALQGLYSTPTDTAIIVPTFPTLEKPVGFGKGNTIVTLGALALKSSMVELDGGRTNAYRRLSSGEDIVPTDLKPKLKIKFELPTVAQKAVYTELETTLDQAFSIVHGTVAGNIFTAAAPRAQLVNISEEKDRTRLFVTADLELLPSSSGVPYTLTLT
ncbi:MAG: hypothetical protein V4451_04685 [Pseudomonadota bacterium]